jgi:acetoin utilization protein AcuB
MLQALVGASIREYMTTCPLTVRPADTVALAQSIMESRSIRHLPVVEGDVLCGIVTDREARLTERIGIARTTLVKDVMFPPVALDQGTPLSRVVSEMAGRHSDAVVITRQGQVVGVFTTVDALRVLSELLVPRRIRAT